MSRTMTLKEYYELLDYIDKNHSFRNIEGKSIKYVGHTFDMRTNSIFSVRFWGGLCDDMDFTTVNENKDRDLKQWIYEWLEG